MSGLTLGIIIGIVLFGSFIFPLGIRMGKALARKSAAGQANRPALATPAAAAPAAGPIQSPTTAAPAAPTTPPPAPSAGSGNSPLTRGDYFRLAALLGLVAVGTLIYLKGDLNQSMVYGQRLGNWASGYFDTTTVLFIGVIVLLATFFMPSDDKLKKALRGLAVIAIVTALFFSGFGQALKRSVSEAERCVNTNDCVSYTAKPSVVSYGYLYPITLSPGQESVAIANYQSSHLRWSLKSGQQMPIIFTRFGHDGPWLQGCLNKGWWYKFVLPTNAPGPVTVQVQRIEGKPSGSASVCT